MTPGHEEMSLSPTSSLLDVPAYFTPDYFDNPHEVGRAYREHAPAHLVSMPAGWPVHVIHRHEDVRWALSRPDVFASNYEDIDSEIRRRQRAVGLPDETFGLIDRNMLFSDPPEHGRLRRFIAGYFRPRRIERIRDQITAAAEDLVACLPAGKFDLITDLATPLPTTVICQILGVPQEDQPVFRPWVAGIMSGDVNLSLDGTKHLQQYLTQLISRKKQEPGSDLISDLATAEDHGDQLSEQEILAAALFVLIAGHETTVNLIGNTVVGLLSEGDLWQQLVTTPALVPAAVKEGGRWDAPVRSAAFRRTTREVNLRGAVIPAGEIALCMLVDANRDPATFDDPDRFDLQRPDTPNLTFGHGIHTCLGQQLGNLEAQAAITALISRRPELTLIPDPERRRGKSVIVNGWESALMR